jgi:hypothetical protein
MRFLKTGLASIMALAIAGSFGVGNAQAFSRIDGPAISSTVEQVAAKPKKAKAAKKVKKAKKAKWKSCGATKYHDKTGKCADATKKK